MKKLNKEIVRDMLLQALDLPLEIKPVLMKVSHRLPAQPLRTKYSATA